MPKSRGRNGSAHRRYYANIRRRANVKSQLASLKTLTAERTIRKSAEVFAIFLAVLAQSGGEVTVTKGTLEQVGQNLVRLGYTVVPGKDENEFVVRMLEGESGPDVATVPETPTVTDEVPNAV